MTDRDFEETRLVVGDQTTMWRPAPARRELARGSSPAPLGLTPLIEREVFQLARRVALQGDLAAAVRVLRHGLVRLTDSQDVTCIFVDAALRSAWAPPAEPEDDAPVVIDGQVQQLVARVAATGQRMVIGTLMVEAIGPAPSRAVLALRRTGSRTPYGGFEVAIVEAVAHAVAGLVGHFLADHTAREEQATRDARTPFRPEVLAERRRATAVPGRVIATPRTWIRWAFPTLIALVTTALLAAAFVQVPTYSTGVAIITVEGEQITSPMAGTVAEILVAPNTHVSAGDPLIRTRAIEEEAEVAAAESDYRNALGVFLANPGDDNARTALAGIATRRQRAKTAVDARTLRATTDGIVGAIRARPGALLVPGAQVMKVARAGAVPSVVALLPGFDRPRLAVGMTVQIDLPGYREKREEAVIDSIDTQVVGPEEARRSLGDPIGDALPVSGPVVIVHAHLAAGTFKAEGREFELYDGMLGKAEVRVSHKSLLRALLPGNEGG